MTVLKWPKIEQLHVGDYVLIFYKSNEAILEHKLQTTPDDICLDDYPQFYYFGIVIKIKSNLVSIKIPGSILIDFYQSTDIRSKSGTLLTGC